MRNAPQKITQSVDMFYRGASTRGVRGHLAMFYPHNASNVSIYKWIVKYAKMIGKFADKLKIKSSGAVEFDEMEYHRRKSHKSKGVDKNWFIDSIDVKTRFMLSSGYVKSRSQKAIKQILLKIKDKAEVEKITTDGFPAYTNVVKKTFGYDKYNQKYSVQHEVRNASQGEGFNYKVERLHSNIRARTKTMRGFHGSINSAYYVMKGYEIYYNFIRQHQAIGKCPYELATDLNLTNSNKWLELIYLSAQKGLKNELA
jgi:transposase-like protein